MIIDSHAHLNDAKLLDQIPQVIEHAKQHDVLFFVCASYDLPSSKLAVSLAAQHSQVFASVGMHPHDAKDYNDEIEQELLLLAKQPRVVAWGEIGLDYHYDHSPREVQKQVFIRQIMLAHQCKLPIIIHMREATQDTLQILKEHKHLLQHGGVMHCYSGSVETAKQALDLGFYLSFAGPLTFSNARELKEVAAFAPLNRILVETDSPYMAPVPLRGTVNLPGNTRYVAQVMANIKQMQLDELTKHTTQNTIALFGLNKFIKE